MQELKVIAHMNSDFPTKFGIPRQSNVAKALEGTIVFEPEYRNPDALRGLEGFSHIWIIWGFSEAQGKPWQPTVRPPRLGGNTRMGVFATRSPYRPNSLGLSCVQVSGIESTPNGPVIHVLGADLMSGTPIYDIKPYLPYADSHPEARGGYANQAPVLALDVIVGSQWLNLVPEEKREAMRQVLAADPRPPYQNDPERVYGMEFAGLEVKFKVEDKTLTVIEIVRL